jgi:uncharacterized protein YlxW (UPF0749 family)
LHVWCCCYAQCPQAEAAAAIAVEGQQLLLQDKQQLQQQVQQLNSQLASTAEQLSMATQQLAGAQEQLNNMQQQLVAAQEQNTQLANMCEQVGGGLVVLTLPSMSVHSNSQFPSAQLHSSKHLLIFSRLIQTTTNYV